MRAQRTPIGNALSAMGMLAIMCCWGCSASERDMGWDLKSEEISGYLAEYGSLQSASITITDMPTPLAMSTAEQTEIIEALKKDTHRFQGDDSFISGASYSVSFNICLFRGPSVLIIGLDYFGLGIGNRDEFRFVNPSFVRAIDKMLGKNGIYTPESADYYRKMLAKGAADPGPDGGPVKAGEPMRVSDVAPQCIASFVDGAGEGEIAVRIHRTRATEISLGPDGADREALIKSLVEDSWPTQRDKAFVSASGRRDALEITVTSDAVAFVFWLDESGFYFGRDGQYRFDNPSLVREIQRFFQEQGIFDLPESGDGQVIVPVGWGKGGKYKHMLEGAGSKPRPEGARMRVAMAARERAKAKAQSRLPPQESPTERAKGLGFELLQDPSRRLKGIYLDAVADGLAKTGKPAVPYLIKGLQSSDAEVRKVSARALATIGPDAKDASEALAKALTTETEDGIASEMAAAIGKVGPPPAECIPALLATLTKRGDFTAVHYSDVMVAIGSPAVPALVAAMESPEKHVQYRAIETLGRIGPGAKGAIDALVKRMRDDSSYFDLVVDKALAGIGEVAIPALMDAARTSGGYVRGRAAHAMGQMGPDAVRHLMLALKNDNSELRAVGAEALGQIEPPPRVVVPALIGLMEDPSDDVRYIACESLARIGDGRALGVMVKAAKDQNSCMRCGAAEALGVFTPATDEAIKTLIGLLRDKDDVVCHTAIIALGKIGPKANGAIPELHRLSETEDDPDTREMAKDALKRIMMPEKKKL